jgi:hypothetical protein
MQFLLFPFLMFEKYIFYLRTVQNPSLMLKATLFKVRPEIKCLAVNVSITVAFRKKIQFHENWKPDVWLNNI